MKLRLALAAATCLALPVVAHAQPVTGPYVSLEAGVTRLSPVNSSVISGGTTKSGKSFYTPSYAGIGSVGYGLGNGIRVQIDFDYLHNNAKKFDASNGTQTRTRGYSNFYGPLFDVIYDFPVNFPVDPYVGAGVGYQLDKAHYRSVNGTDGGTRGSFAYDLIAGVSYPIAAVPGLAVTAEYRFQEYLGPKNFKGSAGTLNTSSQYSNSVLLGLRYALFAAPAMAPAPEPAPVAAPAPMAAARTYLVFFDWDKYNLSSRADEIIQEAATDSKTNTTILNVSGYTDTSGTAKYNQALSERRAKAVEAKLVADGVPMSEIAIHAFGDTHLLVPTGPGVREPQNRRVEIVLN